MYQDRTTEYMYACTDINCYFVPGKKSLISFKVISRKCLQLFPEDSEDFQITHNCRSLWHQSNDSNQMESRQRVPCAHLHLKDTTENSFSKCQNSLLGSLPSGKLSKKSMERSPCSRRPIMGADAQCLCCCGHFDCPEERFLQIVLVRLYSPSPWATCFPGYN